MKMIASTCVTLSRALAGATNQTALKTLQTRSFMATSLLSGKKSKDQNVNKKLKGSETSKIPGSLDKAYNFDHLQDRIKKSLSTFSDKLVDLKSSGRLSPKTLEVLPIKIDDQQYQLKDYAQIVTRGQYLNIILNDVNHIKPAKSAILGSNLSLAPQGPTSEAPTTITVHIPPKTGQDRAVMAKEVKGLAERAHETIRRARHEKHEELKKLAGKNELLPDALHKALAEMEKVVKKGNEEVNKVAEGGKLALS